MFKRNDIVAEKDSDWFSFERIVGINPDGTARWIDTNETHQLSNPMDKLENQNDYKGYQGGNVFRQMFSPRKLKQRAGYYDNARQNIGGVTREHHKKKGLLAFCGWILPDFAQYGRCARVGVRGMFFVCRPFPCLSALMALKLPT